MHSLKKVITADDWRDYHFIRKTVLFDARGKTGYREDHEDEYKPGAHSLLLTFEGQNIGTVRVDNWEDGQGVMRMVAIRQEMQRQGYGRILSVLTENYARALGIRVFYVNAALESQDFYHKMGWHEYEWDVKEALQYGDYTKQMRKELA